MIVIQHVLSTLHALSLSHGSRTTPTSTYIYCTGGTDCLSCTLGTHLAVPSELRQDRDNFPVNPPSRVLTAHAEWLSGVQLRHSVCAVHIEVCEGWWLSGCRGSMAKHWRLKPELSWVWLPVTAGLFPFLYFLLITSKFFLFQHEAKCSEHEY